MASPLIIVAVIPAVPADVALKIPGLSENPVGKGSVRQIVFLV